MTYQFKLVILLIILSLMGGCRTTNLREGIESFRAQDYRKAFVRLKPEAARGQPDAQYAIGYMYYYGQGVVEDRKQAWYWINQAASARQSDALAAVQILNEGTMQKRKIFESSDLQHFPVHKDMY